MKSAWDRVCLARMPERPKALDYINEIFTDFMELHGDRNFGDDKSIVGGIAILDGFSDMDDNECEIKGIPVTVIGEQKGKKAKENMERNFGMPNPEGYRKALRLMKQAEKFNRPIITFIDTPGAYPGMGAEERGQGEAIAKNMLEMAQLKVPIMCVFMGKSSSVGSGARAGGYIIVMPVKAVYSILSPEGFASILYKDSSRAFDAAENMKITAQDLKNLNVIDEIIDEPDDGAQEDFSTVANNLKMYIIKSIKELTEMPTEELIEKRYEKFRNMGK